MTEKERLTDLWKYIQGGFTYIDGTGENKVKNTVALSLGDLSAFVASLTDADEAVKAEVTALFGLDATAEALNGLPKSFLVMLDCDADYLKTDTGARLDDKFGSVAIALLYRDVAALMGASTPLPAAMLAEIEEKCGRKPIVG